MRDVEAITDGIRRQQKRAIARGLTWVEQGYPEGKILVQRLFGMAGHAHIVGITGAPGVGKSTLVNTLTLALRGDGLRVGILAVDPSSPFTGGAILGDRIRMQDSVMDEGVFMRSLASRGYLGGLSRATFGGLTLLDAAGYDVILIETVGAGQSEVEIMRLAHTTMVVLAPGLGDDIQAIKAGILEIGQIFVVNKADRDGADNTVRAIRGMLTLASNHPDWLSPIIKTVAESGDGLRELVGSIKKHRAYLEREGLWDDMRAKQTEHVIRQRVEDWALHRLDKARHDAGWEETVERVATGQWDADDVAARIFEVGED